MQSFSGSAFHTVMELLAYFVAAQVYWRLARAEPIKPSGLDRLALLAGAVFGAALGSKGLHVLQHLPALMAQADLQTWLGGKSVLGGFLGGTVGVEIAKRLIGWRAATGDPWVPALAVGLVLGRIGCQFSGTWDGTYGTPTSLAWAWDYGDGIGRHPTALYEITAVITLALLLRANSPRAHLQWRRAPGARFAAFLLGYCVIRFVVEFAKPPFGLAAGGSLETALYSGLTAIQWAALIGALAYAKLLHYRLKPPANGTAH